MTPTVVPFTDKSRVHARWFLSKFTNTYGTQFTNIEADYAALAQIITDYDCHSVLEVGTWEGYASLFMWLHPNVERLVALDICEPTTGHHSQPCDYGRYFKYTTPAKLLIGNSNELRADKEFDLVFIDAAHEFEQVKRDFETAKKAARKIVAFHDWWNGNPGVDDVIVQAPERFKLIDGSNVAFTEL